MSSRPRDYQLLCEAFDSLPGIGAQAAERLAEWLVYHGNIAQFSDIVTRIKHSERCRLCNRIQCQQSCQSGDDVTGYFVIASTEVLLEQLSGLIDIRSPLFVLHGELSPANGTGPSQLCMDDLLASVEAFPDASLLALCSDSVEGRTTAEYIFRRTGRVGEHVSVERACEILRGHD
jgi:recombination protein RecR